MKDAVAKAKCPHLNALIDKLADIEAATLLQDARDQADYEDRALAYHYYLSLILRGFNQAKLEVLSLTSLPFLYEKFNKKGKKALKDLFELAYHQVEQEIITRIVAEIEICLKTFTGNKYYDKYHLVQ